MIRYTMRPDDAGVTIRLQRSGTGRKRLIGAFEQCSRGECDCPTNEYDELSSLSIGDDEPDVITLRLDTKQGQLLNHSQIDACLRYMVEKADGQGA